MNVKVRLIDLQRHTASFRDDALEALSDVLDSGVFTQGPQVEAFESECAEYCGVRHAVGVNSGTSALHLTLLAAGIGPGDEVITTALTFLATAAAIRYCGATPVFVDVDSSTLNIDPDRIEQAISSKTKAIIAVHLYGCAADMDPIVETARQYGLLVIEDAAQAQGGAYKGRPVGSIGDVACLSFYPTKNLGACGEGGAVLTNSEDLAATVRRLRNWGQSDEQSFTYPSFNYRMDEFQGALLRIKLRKLDDWIAARRERAAWYRELLDGTIELLTAPSYIDHAFHLFVVQPDRRSEFRNALLEQGIQTGIHYPTAVHMMPGMTDIETEPGRLAIAETAASRVVSLPMYPELSRCEVERVVAAIKGAARRPASTRSRQADGP